MLYSYWGSYIIIIPGLLLTMLAQFLVSSTYSRYSKIAAKSGWTADEISKRLLAQNGCNVRVAPIAGNLTDNYNPSNKVLSLSQTTYGRSSIAALGVAAHEVGHAVQDKRNYLPLRFRSFLVPVVNWGSRLAVPLLLIGLLVDFGAQATSFGGLFIDLAIIAYSLATVFALVTLPVEFNASHRALKMLKNSGSLNAEELSGARKVLTAAAMTYVASMFLSLLYLVRFIFIASRFRRK